MSLTDLLNSLDQRPEVRFREFEQICRWFLLNAPEYRSKLHRVWLWSDWPGGWGRDAGIDLIAEEHGGALWAVQAKLYDQAYAIKKADVDSFLSESARHGFAYRLLIATTDRLGPTARRTLDGQRQPVGYLLRSQLELAQVAWPASTADLRPQRPPKKTPLPHVRQAVKASTKGLQHARRGQLIMACGTGKTLAGLWIAERLDSTRTLVLVPSLSLLAQTLREWSANAAQPFEYLAVCSDQTVVGQDEFVQNTAELAFPVTTNPKEIAAFLRRRARRVVFATYQSSPQIAAAYRTRTPTFDLAIADEAHRCAGRVARDFATILNDRRIKCRRRLFMTATPRYYTPRVRHEAGLLDVEVASMDDEAAFGPVLHRLTFGEAIERELLSDYQVVVVGVDDDTYRTWAEHGELVTRDGKRITDARALAGQIALAKTMRKYDVRRVISFHGRVNAAVGFSTEMPDVIAWMPPRARPTGTLWSEHVSGAMPSGRRDRLLLRFRDLAVNERGLLSNARCLAEGVDVPTLDGVAFIDPRRSTIDIIQAVGRAIRKAPGKKLGTIILPVFLSEAEDPEEALDDSTFNSVWDVLKALRAHDGALGEELDELRRSLGARRLQPRRPGKIKLDVPVDRVGAQFSRAFNVRLVEQTTASWEFWYGMLEKYVARTGNARVPHGHREDSFRLGQWTASQRVMFRGRQSRGGARLSAERARRLESLPGWTWDPFESDWEAGYTHLLCYAEREGHARVLPRYLENGFRLGEWVELQRQMWRTGQLDPARRDRLGSVPGWFWDPLEADWNKAFELLRRYVVREGHPRVVRSHTEKGFELGRWIGKQRQSHRQGSLSRARRKRLEALQGWTWDYRDSDWEEGYARLLEYVKSEGHCRLAALHIERGFPLGRWVSKQRDRRKQGTLREDRRQKLEAVKGWVWDERDAGWEHAFDLLGRYAKREGHTQVPRDHQEAGLLLGRWVISQQQRFRRDRLDEARKRQLEDMPGWVWTPRDARWEEGFARLVTFVQREGHARVPREYRADGFDLGNWVVNQRLRVFSNPERRARLEALPGWSWRRAAAGQPHNRPYPADRKSP